MCFHWCSQCNALQRCWPLNPHYCTWGYCPLVVGKWHNQYPQLALMCQLGIRSWQWPLASEEQPISSSMVHRTCCLATHTDVVMAPQHWGQQLKSCNEPLVPTQKTFYILLLVYTLILAGFSHLLSNTSNVTASPQWQDCWLTNTSFTATPLSNSSSTSGNFTVQKTDSWVKSSESVRFVQDHTLGIVNEIPFPAGRVKHASQFARPKWMESTVLQI